jgi:hypothetical protein
MYRAATAHALVGGDLYAAVRTGRTTRFLKGDVRGKGLPAIEDASALLHAFREGAHEHETLPKLAASLGRSVHRHPAEMSERDPTAPNASSPLCWSNVPTKKRPRGPCAAATFRRCSGNAAE